MATHNPTDIKEIWKTIPDFPNYEISNLGCIRRRTTGKGTWPGRTLKPWKVTSGYLAVRLEHRVGRSQSSKMIHTLVASVFLGPRPKGMDINHKDGVKTNNRADNLEYVSRSENKKHAFRLGLQVHAKGEDHYGAKLTNEQVRNIRQELQNYRRGDYTRLGRQYSVSWFHVRQIHLGRKRKDG